MLCPTEFYNRLLDAGIDFFSGVPDSLLQPLCEVIDKQSSRGNHVIAANEGNALSLAAGYYLATSKVGAVYLQNSGLGNLVNPLLSLTDSMVYRIPALLIIGWRAEPGVSDEPQHKKQGLLTMDMLELLGIRSAILDASTEIEEVDQLLAEAKTYMIEQQQPFALVVKKNTFEPVHSVKSGYSSLPMTREEAIELVVDSIESSAVIVSTTGKTSRELYELRKSKGMPLNRDFLTVGSMGHSSQIALGISLAKKHLPVYCIDGEGAMLMHMGALAINGDYAGENYTHIIINNGIHESVGGQPNSARSIHIADMARACGYKRVFSASTEDELKAIMAQVLNHTGACLVEVKVNAMSRKDLGRPETTPIENKIEFMNFIESATRSVLT
ncbi:phosphonopyruvate decarboxylase [Paenibacillus nanensis]|uniref:Phosphonopyruvate decarboxylase n=1 Tax=Paenibacillus nanensis TaxID=393251 RepID=A0A3A1UP73_9BACL|nr:phosphonopyruvate decarboxylase [Paenibacillus nanensis]RIX47316.1 phosphonopyruvate decarboxylase [Paenibacillus nanensis]